MYCIVARLGCSEIDPITKIPDEVRYLQHPWGLDIKFTSIFKDLVHWILSALFGLIYSVLMSQRHAGH